MPLFKPTFALRSILEITPESLKKHGVEALLLDVDNTLTTHNHPEPAEGITDWISRMKSAGIKLIIVSNNKPERVAPFAEKLGLRFVPNGAKPLPHGFLRAVKELGMDRRRVCAVGDQIFTDILGANLSGIRSIFVCPIEPEKSFFFKLKRTLEKPFLPKVPKKFDDKVFERGRRP